MSTATLTREQVLAMEAGPEMDALIETHVMGWMDNPPTLPFSSNLTCSWQVMERISYSSELKELFAIEAVKVVELREVPITTMTHDCFGGNTLQWRPRTHQVFSLCHLRPVDLCRAALLATLGAEA